MQQYQSTSVQSAPMAPSDFQGKLAAALRGNACWLVVCLLWPDLPKQCELVHNIVGQDAYTGFLEDPQAIIEAEQYAEDQRNIDMLLYDDTGQQGPVQEDLYPTQHTLHESDSKQSLPDAEAGKSEAPSLGLVQYSSSDEDAV